MKRNQTVQFPSLSSRLVHSRLTLRTNNDEVGADLAFSFHYGVNNNAICSSIFGIAIQSVDA